MKSKGEKNEKLGIGNLKQKSEDRSQKSRKDRSQKSEKQKSEKTEVGNQRMSGLRMEKYSDAI